MVPLRFVAEVLNCKVTGWPDQEYRHRSGFGRMSIFTFGRMQ